MKRRSLGANLHRSRVTSSDYRCGNRRVGTRALSILLLASQATHAFVIVRRSGPWNAPAANIALAPSGGSATSRFIYAPPGSGYATPEDEKSSLPDSYDPMMEYPGTMRPGRTPENMPFHDLPIGDDDPDPVPWPHFQQIEWHHQWEPPHEHPIPMEEFIELQGRWATPEMEVAMRAGARQNVRERKELAEAEKRETIITDDDDDEILDQQEEPVALGDGVFGKLGSDADRAATAAATSPDAANAPVDADATADGFDDGLDDFLLDLGLDLDLAGDGTDESDSTEAMRSSGGKSRGSAGKGDDIRDLKLDFDSDDDDDDEEEEEESIRGDSSGVTATINVDDDSDLQLGLDDDDELDGEGVDTVPLEDFGDEDTLDTEDIFDEGGFDYDGDYGDDGSDMW